MIEWIVFFILYWLLGHVVIAAVVKDDIRPSDVYVHAALFWPLILIRIVTFSIARRLLLLLDWMYNQGTGESNG